MANNSVLPQVHLYSACRVNQSRATIRQIIAKVMMMNIEIVSILMNIDVKSILMNIRDEANLNEHTEQLHKINPNEHSQHMSDKHRQPVFPDDPNEHRVNLHATMPTEHWGHLLLLEEVASR